MVWLKISGFGHQGEEMVFQAHDVWVIWIQE